ncbi:protein-tyrosine phosphatase [Tahibacter aquaticus]|uniref:protein-tyrosine-phosphatase n=1 Tax=Tahibacter aquaticus TaxID=520092 RepID=A0A4R6YML2_9GAMM|nr:CpsB/CapC family capsule biosynthesis tyrosine phosphatase [Tahibacter aquaticus]TDR38594.1 protein-tyrosine phosphatase [Tahibacter aquaticus]
MIDLHCHLLPGIDDGSADLSTSLAMARAAVADGIRVTACTPHIYPGLYENVADGIRAATWRLAQELRDHHINLSLVCGADIHLVPGLLSRLRDGSVPTLNNSRYFLLEPPHHVAPPRFEASVFELMMAGYVPIITHPERLSWIETHYSVMQRLVHRGVWMQVTSGSLAGRFGKRPRYWGERMLSEGLVHLLATDSHGIRKRPPLLAEGRDLAARRIGDTQAAMLVDERPRAILMNMPPSDVRAPQPPARAESYWRRMQEMLPWR